ncbi:hypothetical protein ACSSS7_004097 [Eimeria intestinalis]
MPQTPRRRRGSLGPLLGGAKVVEGAPLEGFWVIGSEHCFPCCCCCCCCCSTSSKDSSKLFPAPAENQDERGVGGGALSGLSETAFSAFSGLPFRLRSSKPSSPQARGGKKKEAFLESVTCIGVLGGRVGKEIVKKKCIKEREDRIRQDSRAITVPAAATATAAAASAASTAAAVVAAGAAAAGVCVCALASFQTSPMRLINKKINNVIQ